MIIAFAILAAFLVGSSLQAQTAEEIIAKHIEATGGVENWQALESMRINASFQVMGMSFPVVVSKKSPNQIKSVIEIEGDQIIEAYDGEIAWAVNPFEGMAKPTKLPKKRQEAFADDAVFESDFINYAEKGHQVELEGTESIEERECFKIKLIRKNGQVEYHFFDTETYFRTLLQISIPSGEYKGEMEETYFDDYRNVGNVVMHHAFRKFIKEQLIQEVQVSEIELNVEMENAVFAFKD